MKNYDLSQFVSAQKEKKVAGTIKLTKEHTYKIKNNAWSYLELINLQEKHKDNAAELGRGIVRIFLGEKALKFVETLDEVAKVQVVSIIVSHITGLSDELNKKNKSNKQQKNTNKKK